MAVLDTSFLLDLERGLPDAQRALGDLESFAPLMRVPAPVWLEYLSGFEPIKAARAAQWLDRTVVFEPMGREIAAHAVRLQRELFAAGRPLAYHDLWIAATAVHHDEELVTRDRGFDDIPGLVVYPY